MLNAVLIGFGYWGPNIAKNLNLSPEYNLTGICDINENALEKAKRIFGDRVKYYTDWQEAIAKQNINVVAVALRDTEQQEVSRSVLERGLNLFIEKPMATNMEDAILLKELAEKNKVKVHVDHQMIFNPFIRRIKSMLDSGELGEIVYIESSRSNLGPHIKKDMNALWDLAVHDVAVLDFFCGGQKPLSVNCIGQQKFGTEEVITYLTIKYDSFVSMIKSNWFSPNKERMMVVSGTKKMVVFDDVKTDEKLAIYDKGIDISDSMFEEYGKLEAKVRLGDLYIPNIDFEDAMLNGLNHFAQCIHNNTESQSNHDAAIRVIDILLKANNAMREL